MGSITGWQTCQVRIVSKLILECLVMENMFASQEKRVNDKVSNSKLVLCWPVLVSVYMGLPWQWEEGQASGFPKKNCATKWNQCLKVVKNVLGGRVKKKKSNSPSKKKKIMVGIHLKKGCINKVVFIFGERFPSPPEIFFTKYSNDLGILFGKLNLHVC